VFGPRPSGDPGLPPWSWRGTGWSGSRRAGPIGALLFLLTGRSAALEQLTGEGADALRSAAPRSA
jgi:hypothetical protein